MAKQQEEALSTWDKVIKWYAGHAYAVNIIYSLGASVVIIGALFKILHWPGASYVLMVGMFTEAFLFILGIFEKPHASYHWENVFPQVVGEDVIPLTMNGDAAISNGDATKSVATSAKGVGNVPAWANEDVEALQAGIASVGKAAQQLSKIGDVATASNGLVAQMNAAQQAASAFAEKQTALATATDNVAKQYATIDTQLNEAVGQVKAHEKGIESLNAQLASINAVYELQLKELQAQNTAYKAHAEAVQAVTNKFNGVNQTIDALAAKTESLQQNALKAAEAGQQYAAAQQQLADQVASLNKIYGNMLSAL